jgi:hypothetical protein
MHRLLSRSHRPDQQRASASSKDGYCRPTVFAESKTNMNVFAWLGRSEDDMVVVASDLDRGGAAAGLKDGLGGHGEESGSAARVL